MAQLKKTIYAIMTMEILKFNQNYVVSTLKGQIKGKWLHRGKQLNYYL